MHVNGLDLEKNDLVSSQSATRRTEQAEGGGEEEEGGGEKEGGSAGDAVLINQRSPGSFSTGNSDSNPSSQTPSRSRHLLQLTKSP
jgi:hypothetical protein